MGWTISRRASQLRKPKENARKRERTGNIDIATGGTDQQKEIAIDIATKTTGPAIEITVMTKMNIDISDHGI